MSELTDIGELVIGVEGLTKFSMGGVMFGDGVSCD